MNERMNEGVLGFRGEITSAVPMTGPMRHIAGRMKLPDLSLDESVKQYLATNPVVPPLFIMNIQIPVHPKAIFGARKLPPTVTPICVYVAGW